MSLDLVVSITDGTLSDLALTPANGYRNLRGGLGPGAREWRMQWAESPYVHGAVLIGRTMALQTATLHVLVEASSAAQLETRMTALLERMEQASYVLQVVIDGVTYRWQCHCADSSVGNAGVFNAPNLMQYRQALLFHVPRQPVPLDGPM